MKNQYFKYLKLPFEVERPDFENSIFELRYGKKEHDLKQNVGYIVKKKHLPVHKKVVDFVNTFDDITVFHVIYLQTGKNRIMTIHNDCPMLDNKTCADSVAINFSYGHPESRLQYFNIDDANNVYWITHNQTNTKDKDAFTLEQGKIEDEPFRNELVKHRFQSIEERYCDFVTETKHDTKHPTLVNLGQFHRAYNVYNQNRYVIQYRLTHKNTYGTEVSFKEASELLKDYIIDLT